MSAKATGRSAGSPKARVELERLRAENRRLKDELGLYRVLRKPGRLDAAEFRQMQRHPALGVEILEHIHYYEDTLPGIRSHHERHDGHGYPDELAGEEIPPIARIIAVADTYDAMTSDRPYRKGLDKRFAVKEIRFCSDSQFDPKVVRAFIKAYREGDITGRPEKVPPRPRKKPRP